MVIFDFDGVIADSSLMVLEILQTLAVKKRVEPITLQMLKDLGLRSLFKHLSIQWYEIPFYLRWARQEAQKQSHRIVLCQAILPVLQQLSKEAIPLAIVSSNTTKFIEKFLEEHLSIIHFHDVIGNAPLFNKHRALKKLLRQHQPNKYPWLTAKQDSAAAEMHCLYIGDEQRDIVAARRAKIPCVAVGWGKDSQQLLLQEKPLFYAKDSQSLGSFLKQWHSTQYDRQQQPEDRPLSL